MLGREQDARMEVSEIVARYSLLKPSITRRRRNRRQQNSAPGRERWFGPCCIVIGVRFLPPRSSAPDFKRASSRHTLPRDRHRQPEHGADRQDRA